MELRRREVDAAGFQCEGCACGLDVGDGASDLDACRRRFAADAFRAFAGPLLERQGHTLQAVQQAMRPCGGPEVCCGDAVVALPTLIHRGPGNASATQTRDVLYFTLQPTGFPNRRRSVPAPLAPDDDSQVSALWLLLLGGSLLYGRLGEGLRRKEGPPRCGLRLGEGLRHLLLLGEGLRHLLLLLLGLGLRRRVRLR